MRLTYLFPLPLLALLSACASGPTPQNAQEYRQAVAKGGYGMMTETYEVKGAYNKVAATLNTKGNECFNKTVTTQECRGASCITRNFILIPRFTGKGNSAELVVQMKTNHVNAKDVYLGGPPPESGMYVAVTDIAPAGSGTTKITMYATNVGIYGHIPKAVKHWANGTNLGCPDFTSDL